MEKYLLIGKKIGTGSGPYYNIMKFSRKFHNFTDFIYKFDASNLERYCDEYKKIIFCCHATSLYNLKCLSKLNRTKCVFFSRNLKNNDITSMFNVVTNGFSLYTKYKLFSSYLPTMSFFNQEVLSPNNNIFGFYVRPMTTLSTSYLISAIKKSNIDIKLITTGVYNSTFDVIDNCNHIHTKDSDIFFNSIDNYIHLETDFLDTAPSMLLEACTAKKNIISFKLKNKSILDGNDDIFSIFKTYDFLDFNHKYGYIKENDYGCELINRLDKLNLFILNNNFEYNFDRSKYKNFYHFLESI